MKSVKMNVETNIPKCIAVFRNIEPYVFGALFFGLSLNYMYGNNVIASVLMPLGLVYIAFEIINGMYWRVERDFNQYTDVNITQPVLHEACAIFIYILIWGNSSKYIPQISSITKIVIFIIIAFLAVLLNVKVRKKYRV